MISVPRLSMALILSSKLLLCTHLKAGKKSCQSTSVRIVLSMTSTNVSKISLFVTTPTLDNQLPLAHNPIFAKRKHIPILGHEKETSKTQYQPQKKHSTY